MKKVYMDLTEDQKSRGIIFASTLSTERTEQEGDTTHEVEEDNLDRHNMIRRLKDDSFFNDSPWTYNIIRN